MTLEWRRIHPEAIGSHSRCRRYSVCRTNDDGTLWEVWKIAPGGPWFFCLAKGLPNETAAQEGAEADSVIERKTA